MNDENKKKQGVPPLEEGDPYVIVVSSGGPPNPDDNEDLDTDGGPIKIKFPFELAYQDNNGSGDQTIDVIIFAEIIDSLSQLITSSSYPMTLSSTPSQVNIKIDYNEIPDDRHTFIRLKWGKQGSQIEFLLLTVPFSFPQSKKEYLKSVKLKYQKTRS
ncbi:MAG: hypothetical protein WBB45_19775 [Cyclobacteriaceae bacterium]